MTFVLDASLTLAWCFRDEATPYTNAVLHALRGTRALVPSLWFYEVTNGLVSGLRRERTSDRGVETFLKSLTELPIDMQPTAGHQSAYSATVRRLAIEHKLSAYDASYLALAIEVAVPLATLDGTGKRQGLKQAAERCGIKLFSPAA